MGLAEKPAGWLLSTAVRKATARVGRTAAGLILGGIVSLGGMPVLDRLGITVTRVDEIVTISINEDMLGVALGLVIAYVFEVGWNRWKYRKGVTAAAGGSEGGSECADM